MKRTIVALSLFVVVQSLFAQDFASPLFVKSSNKIIDYQDRPYSAPVIYDFNKDGLNDLLVGHYYGYFYVYLNKGSKTNPVFEDSGFVQAGGEKLQVDNWCCIAPSGQFIDINGDGNDDFIIGSYSGMSYICYGQKNGTLNKAEFLLDKDGNPVNAGKFYDLREKGSPPEVCATDEIKKSQSKNDYKGNFIKAHDYDGDGDLDLFISAEKYIMLRKNIGSKRKPVFDTEIIEIAADRIFADAMVDWDGDGLWDIIGGSRSGGVYFYKNIGANNKPKFAAAKCIVKAENLGTPGVNSKGNMSQVEVADFNADKKLDLILGNQAIDRIPAPKMTVELQKELDKILKREKEVNEKIKEIQSKFEEKANGDRLLMRKLAAENEELKELNKERFSFYKLKSKFKDKVIAHGYVTVLLAK